jgi:hypothetical protein
MIQKKKKIFIILVIILSVFVSFYLVGLPERIENKEIASVFNRFEKAYNSGQYKEAYSLMTPRYRISNDMIVHS